MEFVLIFKFIVPKHSFGFNLKNICFFLRHKNWKWKCRKSSMMIPALTRTGLPWWPPSCHSHCVKYCMCLRHRMHNACIESPKVTLTQCAMLYKHYVDFPCIATGGHCSELYFFQVWQEIQHGILSENWVNSLTPMYCTCQTVYMHLSLSLGEILINENRPHTLPHWWLGCIRYAKAERLFVGIWMKDEWVCPRALGSECVLVIIVWVGVPPHPWPGWDCYSGW